MTSSGSQFSQHEARNLFALYSAGRFQEALIEGRQLQRQFGDAPLLLNLLGAIYAAQEQFHEASQVYRRAIEVHPGVADTHYYLANSLSSLGLREEAISQYRQAIALRPTLDDAHSGLCRELERANQLDQLRSALEFAELHCSSDLPSLQLRRAELLVREGALDEVRRLLEKIDIRRADTDTLQARAYLLADVCDRLDDTSRAFQYAEEANERCRTTLAARRIRGQDYLDQIRVIGECLLDIRDAAPAQTLEEEPRPTPVFLVGFPRSGTTLLDTLLRGHSCVVVVEEKPMVSVMEHFVSKLPEGYPQALATLGSEQLQTLRAQYFEELDKHVGVGDSTHLVIDKLPLNLVHAGMLYRVFPDAKFIFAKRHPCDAVLSGFMREFSLNEGMVHLLNLTDAANLYCEAMALWRATNESLPLQVHEITYETLVHDPEPELRALLEFLELDWEQQILQQDATALSRSDMATPSYRQVSEPIHQRAAWRWQHYRQELSPVLTSLLPWAKRLGYGVD
jgi:tetratricopeptide (TPR) repeat protein